MKRIIQLSLLLLAILLPATVAAYDFEVDGIYYNINGSNVTVTSGDNQYTGDITIPETVTYNGTTYSVTSIGDYAFHGCSSLTSIEIPDAVTSIGDRAFYGCSSLTSIDIPDAVTSIGDYVFSGCSSLTSIDIPDAVTSIGYEAFSYCSSLTSVTIGNSVTSIGGHAFYNCNLKTLIFNAVSCTSIAGDAFKERIYTSYITTLHFGDHVEYIPANLPYLSMSGKVLTLPNSVKTIAAGAIRGNCAGVVIGTGIENIEAGAFESGISVAYATSAEPLPCEAGAFANPQTLYVPVGSKNKYFTASGWGEFANIIESEYIPADSIELDNTTAVLPKGTTLQLNTTIFPTEASATSIDWLSKNKNIATVNAEGLVTAVAVGETDVMALVDNVYAVCHVTVTPVLVESLTLSDKHLSMTLDEMYTLVATITPDNAENKTLEWIVSDSSILQSQPINNNKLNISAEGEGTVTIVVRTTDGSNLSDTCEVFVSSNTPVKNLTISPETLSLYVGYTQQLTATITPLDAYNKDLRWFSTNENVATVDANGLVTARSVGTANITVATTDGSNLSATCALTVTNVPVESVTLNQTELNMTEGSTATLSATVLPDDAMNKSLTWASSNPRVATVNSNGRVTAVGVGTTIVTATTTDGTDLSAACRVTVKSQTASNCFLMPDTAVLHGDAIVIPVRLNNTESIFAFQTDVYLPEGFTLAFDDGDEYIVTPADRLTSDHVLMTQPVSNGAVRVLCYTPNSQPINGNSGDLFYITVNVPDDAEGDYAINLRNSRLTNTDYEEISIPDAGAVLTVNTFIPGDVNDSRTVTVTDIVVSAQYIMELNPSPFIFAAADMNGDGDVTVTDIMLIAYLINHPTMNAPKRMPVLDNNNDCMRGEDVTLMAGETRTVSIMLDNEADYSAFQLDLRLPEGLTASNFQLTDRAGSHAFDVNTLGNGEIRALCYSPAIEAIGGHSGALLTFDVTAIGNVEGNITIDGIELVTTDCQTVLLDGFAIGVNNSTAVSEMVADKAIAKVEYFNISGQRMVKPADGVTIVVTTYTDGTCTTAKVIR